MYTAYWSIDRRHSVGYLLDIQWRTTFYFLRWYYFCQQWCWQEDREFHWLDWARSNLHICRFIQSCFSRVHLRRAAVIIVIDGALSGKKRTSSLGAVPIASRMPLDTETTMTRRQGWNLWNPLFSSWENVRLTQFSSCLIFVGHVPPYRIDLSLK